MYKVFINEHLVTVGEMAVPKPNSGAVLNLNEPNESDILVLVDYLLRTEEVTEVGFFAKDASALWVRFRSAFTVIKAAGGVIKDQKGRMLMIRRFNKWDLPKGKMEGGESPNEAAIREVEEECGVKDLVISKELGPTYHIYQMGEVIVLKETHWFAMQAKHGQKLVPQTEEGITEVRWIDQHELPNVRKDTYASLLELIR